MVVIDTYITLKHKFKFVATTEGNSTVNDYMHSNDKLLVHSIGNSNMRLVEVNINLPRYYFKYIQNCINEVYINELRYYTNDSVRIEYCELFSKFILNLKKYSIPHSDSIDKSDQGSNVIKVCLNNGDDKGRTLTYYQDNEYYIILKTKSTKELHYSEKLELFTKFYNSIIEVLPNYVGYHELLPNEKNENIQNEITKLMINKTNLRSKLLVS